MAIIYSYPETTQILLTDMLIGTSTIRVAGKKKNLTKNFTIETLGGFIHDNFPTQWGEITGTLSNQIDLQAALDSKQGNITLTTIGTSGVSTLIGDTLNIPNYLADMPTKTSDLTNDGEDGTNPFITALDIPPSITPNLQSVTDEGNTTTNQIIVESGQYKNSVGIADVRTENTTTGTSIYLSTDDGVVISNASGSGRIKADTIALGNNPDFQLPNKSGTFTIATIDDIPTLTSDLTNDGADGVNPFITLNDIPAGGLTSVGLTMPAAFSVANSPLTSDGTIAVAAAGTSAQYIRGDGQLATLPSGGGGGASVFYYLNGSIAASVATYKQLSNTAVIGAGTDFSITGNGLITQFLTDVGNPNRLQIPSGAWNFEMFFSMSSSGGTPKFYVELLKYNGATFTTIANNSTVPETITGGTSIDLYLSSLAVPETTLLLTDRLAIRVYIVNNSGGRTATLYTEDNHLCQIITTFASGISAINGLNSNNQYLSVGTTGTDFNISSVSETHTFNLPTASATNRGALSTTDWSAFNAKQNALTNPITGTGTINYLPKFTGASTLGDSAAQDNGTSIIIEKAISNSSAAPLMTRNLTPYSAPNYNQFSQIWLNSGGGIMAYIRNDGTFLTTNAVKSNYFQGAISGSATAPVLTVANGVGLFFPSSTDVAFTTASTERMRINAAGNVGIGTTAPAAKLQVNAPGALSTDLAFKIRNSADSLDLIKVNGLGQTSIGQGTATLTNMLTVQDVFSTSVAIEFRSDQNPRVGSTFNTSRILSGYSSGTASFLDLQYAGGAYPYTYTTGLRLNSAGNVGIGTTAPATLLDVNGVGTFIAYSTPTLLTKISGSYGQVITMARNGAGNNVGLGVAASGELSFYTNNVETIRIHSSGNLLIGTTTNIGSSKLTIESTTQGFLPPRMTNAQRIAIATPAVGLCVYCTDVVEGLYINKSTGWTYIG
jgi:hypothetical protein